MVGAFSPLQSRGVGLSVVPGWKRGAGVLRSQGQVAVPPSRTRCGVRFVLLVPQHLALPSSRGRCGAVAGNEEGCGVICRAGMAGISRGRGELFPSQRRESPSRWVTPSEVLRVCRQLPGLGVWV